MRNELNRPHRYATRVSLAAVIGVASVVGFAVAGVEKPSTPPVQTPEPAVETETVTEADETKMETPAPNEKRLGWVPDGRPQWHAGWISGHARGIQLIANYLGKAQGLPPVDYDTVLGDLGAAFTMQANALGTDTNNDVGWWPMDPLCLRRLDFLSQTIGWEIREVRPPADAPPADIAALYAEVFEPAVHASLNDEKPCLVGFSDWWCVVTGYDATARSLFGMCPNEREGQEKVSTVEVDNPPGWMIVFGERVDRIDRKTADREALRFAIDLHSDRGPHKDRPGWCTGTKAFRCWIDWLRKEDRVQVPRPHANAKGFLIRNRRTAVRYLQAMQQRHPEAVSQHLAAAVGEYEEVIRTASAIDTSADGVSTPDGQQKMIAQIERIIELEDAAAEHLAAALAAGGAEEATE